MIIEKGVIDYDVKEGKEIIAKDNKIIDLDTGKTLLEFEYQVIDGICIINNNSFYGSDVWGTRKVLKYSRVFEVPYIPKSVLVEDSCIVRFKKSKTTAKIDFDENIIWEHPLYPVLGGIHPDLNIIVFLDGAGTPQKKLHFAQISTGKILSSFDCGENVPRILGANSEIVWLASEFQKYIKSVDIKSGQMVDEVSAASVEEIIQNNINIEYFKFDSTSLKLIHPYGDFELSSKRFVKRKYFESTKHSGDVWMPSVFPFTFNDKCLVFGLQIDYTKTKETETRLIVIQRADDKVILDVSINIEKSDAGLKKIVLMKEKLTYIDSINNLHQLTINQHE